MTIANLSRYTQQALVGAFSNPAARHEIAEVLDAAKGAFDAGSANVPGYFTTIDATGNVLIGGTLGVTGAVTGASFSAGDNSLSTLGLTVDGGIIAFQGGTDLQFSGATGTSEIQLQANLADALSWTDGTTDLIVMTTTTSDFRFLLNMQFGSTPPANQTLTNDATITLPTAGFNKVVDNAGNVTGIILTAGAFDGQVIIIANTGTGSVTFATAATSNVADGTSAVIATLRAVMLMWDLATTRWVRTG